MTTSCILFFSKAGIVGASDSDFSIRPMSKKCPVAIAVNTYSPIPWKMIIDDYLLENEGKSFSTVKELYESFLNYFKERQVPASVFKNKPEEHILFMGFNEDNLYPSLMDSQIEANDENHLVLTDFYEKNVNHEDFAFYAAIGDFKFVSPILAGATDSFMESIQKNEEKLLSIYRDNLLVKVKGMPNEKKLINDLENFNIKEAIEEKIVNSISGVLREVFVGIDTFSIQDMVDYAESLVNAEVRLRSLKNKENGSHLGTREIAVITIPEGLTWIKHHLFAI